MKFLGDALSLNTSVSNINQILSNTNLAMQIIA